MAENLEARPVRASYEVSMPGQTIKTTEIIIGINQEPKIDSPLPAATPAQPQDQAKIDDIRDWLQSVTPEELIQIKKDAGLKRDRVW